MFDELNTPYKQDEEPKKVKTIRLAIIALLIIGIVSIGVPVGLTIKQYFFTIPASGETNMGEMKAFLLAGDVDPIESINYGVVEAGGQANITVYCRNEMNKPATVTGVQMIDASEGANQITLTAIYTPILIQPMDYMPMVIRVGVPANFTYAYWSFNIKVLYEA